MSALKTNPTTTKPRSLTLVAEDQISLAELLTDTSGDVSEAMTAEAVEAWFAEIKDNAEAGIDRTAAVVREMDLEAEAIKLEEQRLAARRKANENASTYLRGKLKWFMETVNMPKIKTARFTVGIQTNGGLAPMEITNEDAIPEQFVQNIRVPMKDAIRKALESGATVPGAALMPRGTSLRIR